MEYIWEYYRWHILFAACTIAFIVSAILKFATYVEPLLSVIMLNSYGYATDSDEQGFEVFFEEYGYETHENALELKKDLFFQGEDDTVSQDYETYEVILALLLSGDYDVFLGTGDLYLELAEQGIFRNLEEVMSKELLEKYNNNLIYSDNFGETEAYPCAVELKNNQWLKDNNYYTGNCYFGIIKKENNSAVATEFAQFLLGYEKSMENTLD